MATYKTLDEIMNIDDRYNINKITFLTHTEDGTLIIPDYNLIDKYRRFIAPYVTRYVLTDKQRDFYRYRPYQLAYDVYGTHALGLLVLILNDKECASKFKLKRYVKLLPPDTMAEIYEGLASRGSSKLEDNWSEQLVDWE